MTVIFVVTGGRDGGERKIKEGIEMNQQRHAATGARTDRRRNGQKEGRTSKRSDVTLDRTRERQHGETKGLT